jgi:hypothetical protein
MPWSHSPKGQGPVVKSFGPVWRTWLARRFVVTDSQLGRGALITPVGQRGYVDRGRTGRAAAGWRDAQTGRSGTSPQGFSFLAGALLASLADLLADGLAPTWLVRVGTCLGARFPRRNLRLCLGRRGLLLEKFGRRLLAIILSLAAKETHSVIVDSRLGDLRISSWKWV